jgi:hypothetical protein
MSFLEVLIVQFGMIIAERVIYIFKSLIAKSIFHFVFAISIHIILFFYLPHFNQRRFHHFQKKRKQFLADFSSSFFDTPALIVFYLLQSMYMGFSALQVLILSLSLFLTFCSVLIDF